MHVDVPYSIHTVDVVKESPAQHAGVHPLVTGHVVIGKITCCSELIIQQVTDVRVQPVHQREAMILPCVVLQREQDRMINHSS